METCLVCMESNTGAIEDLLMELRNAVDGQNSAPVPQLIGAPVGLHPSCRRSSVGGMSCMMGSCMFLQQAEGNTRPSLYLDVSRGF